MKHKHPSKPSLTSSNKKQAGFTLGEVVIVIAVIAILAAMITPLAVGQITQKRFDFCREELENIKIAIVGNPELLESGSRTSFGFLGDMGQLPSTLTALLDPLQNSPTCPLATVTSGVVDWGWRGPYIAEIIDPWGRDYQYNTNPAQLPAFISARIWSLGPDATTGTADDLSVDIRLDDAFSKVTGNCTDACGAGTGSDIILTYPSISGGVFTLSTFTHTTDQTNPIYKTNVLIPIGLRHVLFGTFQRLVFINNGPTTIVNLKTPGPCT